MLKKSKTPRNEAWYKDGLAFECHRCGHCCTFPGGYVWLSLDEIQALADHLGLDVQDFGRKYLRRYQGKYSLTEKTNGHCVFYRNGGCSVYQLRPTQCRTFPFWPENMASEESWNELARTCRGVHQGPTHSQSEIDEALRIQKASEI